MQQNVHNYTLVGQSADKQNPKTHEQPTVRMINYYNSSYRCTLHVAQALGTMNHTMTLQSDLNHRC